MLEYYAALVLCLHSVILIRCLVNLILYLFNIDFLCRRIAGNLPKKDFYF